MSIRDPIKRGRQKNSDGLTVLEKRFVEEYLIDLNAKEAIIRAGYNTAYPKQQGHEMLQKPKIIEAIMRAQAKRARRTRIDQNFVLAELASQYRRASESAGVGEKSRPAERAQALRALENIGRHVDVMAFRHQIGLGNPDGSNYDFGALTDDDLATLEQILKRLAAPGSGEGGDSSPES